MSILDNIKYFHRWIAALLSDYEMVISQFMTEDDWSYKTFRDKMTSCGTRFLHHCAVGKGKRMNEQYEFITRILLQQAKDCWLLAPMLNMLACLHRDEKPQDLEPATRVKQDTSLPFPWGNARIFFRNPRMFPWKQRRSIFYRGNHSYIVWKQMVAGLYLTFGMYKTKIRDDDGIRIMMSSQDIVCFHYFRKCLVETEGIPIFVKKHIQFLLGLMTVERAFETVSESTMKGIDPFTRLYNNVVRSNIGDVNQELKDWQYNYIAPINLSDISKMYNEHVSRRTEVMKEATSSISAVPLLLGSNAGEESALQTENEGNQPLTIDLEPEIRPHFESVDDNNLVTPVIDDDGPSEPGPSTSSKETLAVAIPEAKTKEKVDDIGEPSLLEMLASAPQLFELADVSAMSHLLTDKPIHTVTNVLANSIADKAMMSDSRKKIERTGSKKSSAPQASGMEIQRTDNRRSRTSERPYIQEGGIFGRKRVNEERDEERVYGERQPIEASENLWSYITTGRFHAGEDNQPKDPSNKDNENTDNTN